MNRFTDLEWAILMDSLGAMEEKLERAGSSIVLREIRSVMNKLSIQHTHGWDRWEGVLTFTSERDGVE